MNWNVFSLFDGKKSKPVVETKSIDGWQNLNYSSSCSNNGLISILSGAGSQYNSISANVLWSWYRSVKPMRHAVEGIVSESFKTIKPAIYDNKERRFLNGDEEVDLSNFLKIFNEPNPYESSSKFKEKLAPSYFVTGNIYIIMDIGVVSNQPLYMSYIPPQDVDPSEGVDGTTKFFTVTKNNRYLTFKRTELEDGRIAYYNEDETKELIQIMNFNPCSNPQQGLSPLSSTLSEIEQYWQGNTHNNSFIAKGARPSGLLMIHPEVELSPQQEERLRSLVEKSTSGENTGKVLVAQGGTSYKELSVNNRDMDYINLMERAKVEIYTTLNIPLPLIRDKAMTLNNYQEAKFMLFDFSIFPFADMFYEELNLRISKYYDTENGRYSISYNKDEVDATKVRRNIEIDRLGQSGVITINEHRDLLNYSPIPEGDTIYQPASEVPIGSSPLQPSDDSDNDSKKSISINKEIFINQLRKTKQFTEDQIQEKAKNLYG